jgi:mono/diheme cytochrome c family protein
MRKIIKWTGIMLGGLIGLALLAGLSLYPIGMKKLTRSYPDLPVEAVNIPSDSDAVARGGHIAIVWACTKCHGADLSGTLLAGDPIIGTIPASNLTSGKGGVASSYTDADWIRAIRHGVKPDGQVEIFMYDYYSTMGDQDLGALIAYLKQIPPVDLEYPAIHFGSILPIAPAVGLFTPAAELIDHDAPRPADPVPGATIEYGRYLSVICNECHGKYVASKLENWKQDDFIHTIQTGVLPDGKRLGPTMSSKTFSEMNDMELSALWLYFMDSRP